MKQSFKKYWQYARLFRKTFFTKHFRIHYSQFGEDIILVDWIKKKSKGSYVDVGCYHPKKFSNTYALYKRGWRGINIDMDPLKIKSFNMVRPDDINIEAAVSDGENIVELNDNGFFSLTSAITEKTDDKNTNFRKVTTRSLNSILKDTPFYGKKFDLLTIDAEGHDFHVLKSLDLKMYQPKIIIIESHFRNFQKINESEMYQYLLNKGYIFSNWVGLSLFFVHPGNDLLKFHLEKA